MKNFDELLRFGFDMGLYTGASAWLGHKGKCLYQGAFGFSAPFLKPERRLGPDSFFDLASLTKPLAASLIFIKLMQEKKLGLEDKLSSFIPEWKGGDIFLYQLLQHRAGLLAYYPFYEELYRLPEKKRKKKRLDMICRLGLDSKPGTRTLYSDIGFMLLAELMERAGGRTLDKLFAALLPSGLEKELFYPSEVSYPESFFVSTGFSRERKNYLLARVHDENAAALGGVEAHAGLFGTAPAVGRLAFYLMDAFYGRSSFLDSGILKTFFYLPGDGKRPLGFDRPSGERPSCGHFFSPYTIGHLGFTGCSLWMDLQEEIVLVLLTNRVHCENSLISIKEFRPFFYNELLSSL